MGGDFCGEFDIKAFSGGGLDIRTFHGGIFDIRAFPGGSLNITSFQWGFLESNFVTMSFGRFWVRFLLRDVFWRHVGCFKAII